MSNSQALIPIRGIIKNYAWGSFHTLAAHRGESVSTEPEAELWFGDSPHGPALLLESSQTLDQFTKDMGQLPFLAKILAVESPLSLQVHPSLADLPELAQVRRDDNHKPEMIVALTDFDALIGLATKEKILSRVQQLNSKHIHRIIAEPVQNGGKLTEVFNQILGIDDHENILEEALLKSTNLDSHYQAWLQELIQLYAPKLDPLALLLCNLIRLAPGESVYLPPRCIHAYLRGTAVEAMANSDNVIRGGLTKKPIDKRNFLALLDESTGLMEKVAPSNKVFGLSGEGVRHWQPPIDDFSLTELQGEFNERIQLANHAIAFSWKGRARINSLQSGSAEVIVQADKGAFLAPGEYEVQGVGSLWVVTGKGR